MRNRVILVRHGDDPPDDRVVTWMTAQGFEPDIRRPFAGDTLGEVEDDIAGTVIYGGKYNAYDAPLHPFLAEEYRWIAACLEADIPMLGICQGAQMIAHHLGAFAGAREGGAHEFGYYELTPTEAGRAEGFLLEQQHFTQAHFHTYELPEGAVSLAGNANYPEQAFRYGTKAYGLQFHPEVTIEGFRRWQAQWPDVYARPGVQSREMQENLMMQHDRAQADWFFKFLETLFRKT